MNNKLKNEKGSITLYVLISMVFFIVVVYGIYFNTTNKVQKQNKEIESIQKQYTKENINDLYEKTYENYENNSTIVEKVNLLSYSDASVTVPNTVTPTLSYSGKPKKIEYISSNNDVATVDNNGVVTGKSVGKATITVNATNYDGTISSKSCTISVSEYLLLGNDLKEARTGGYEWHVDLGNKLSCMWQRKDIGQELIVSYAYNVGWLISKSTINFDNIARLKYTYSNYYTNYPETMRSRLVVGAAYLKDDQANFSIGYEAIERTLYSDSNYWHSGEITANVSNLTGENYLKMRLDRFDDVEAYTSYVTIRSILAEP